MAITIKQALGNLSRSLESYFYYITTESLTIAEATETESSTETPDLLLFQYTIDDIFNDVKMLSANMGKHAISEKAGDMFDAIAITEEDRDLFYRFLKSASLHAYTKIQGLAKYIDPAFLFDEGLLIEDWKGNTAYGRDTLARRNNTIYKALDDVDTDPEIDVDNWEEMPDYIDTTDRITYLILNNETYDTNVIRVWNDNIRDIIIMYVLEKIFKFRNIAPDLLAIVLDEKVTKEKELVSTISSRKTPVKRFVAWM